MNTLTIKLKQHTPLIHFQHDQEGATLRASEVKPKLDKYIVKNAFQGDFERCKQYLVGYTPQKEKEIKAKWDCGYRALDYKIKIEAPKVEVIQMGKYPLFFGNMTSSDDIDFKGKEMTFCKNLNLNIFSFYEDLIDRIKELKDAFFFLNNFGTRQSKGFGCFLPDDIEMENFIYQCKFSKFEWISNNYNFEKLEDFRKLFSAIDLFCKSIRSGINQNGLYLKSLMYFYAKEDKSKNEYWDKRAIRYEFGHFTPNKLYDKGEKADKKHDGDFQKGKARLYRDMLGLSSNQSWRKYDDIINKEHMPPGETKDEKEKNRIVRFKSPLLIKPIYNNNRFDIYIIPFQIPKELKDATFIINSSKRGRSFEMRTPLNFDTEDYIQFVSSERIKGLVKKRMNDYIKNADNRIKEIENEQLDKERKEKIIKGLKNGRRMAYTLLSIFNSIQYGQHN